MDILTVLQHLKAAFCELLGPFRAAWYPNERVTKIGTVWLFYTLQYSLDSGNANYCILYCA